VLAAVVAALVALLRSDRQAARLRK
jgi:hypothetical protein